MNQISESEFQGLCRGIIHDRKIILKHNPIGSDDVTLLWMLLSCLDSYLSLSDEERPCFRGVPDEKTYRDAIYFVLANRRLEPFDIDQYIDEMLKSNK